MKRRIIFLMVSISFPSVACHLSNFSLTNITSLGGGNYQIDAQLCIGGGITGVVSGAGSDTYDIAFGIYGPGGAPVNIISYSPNLTPPLLTSGFTGCEMPGYDIGPVGSSPFFTQATIYYVWDPFTYPNCTNGFECVTTTALCGNVNQDCFNFQFVTDVLPDSIRVFGVEGSGNPVAGCMPDPDMLIDFNIALNVQWGEISATAAQESILVNWQTITEKNNDHFIVERFNTSREEWEDLAIVNGSGTTELAQEYSVKDSDPLPGINYYRIVQVDHDGRSSKSTIINAELNEPELSVFVDPATGELFFKGQNGGDYSLLDLNGKVIYSGTVVSSNEPIEGIRLDTGIYFFTLTQENNRFQSVKVSVINAR